MGLLSIKPVLLVHLPGGDQWIWILLAVGILFGGKKIPELAKGIGKGIREFNDAKDGVKNEIESGIKDKDKTTPNTNA
jgi:sec-independent protein translocase protein TatA